MAIVSIFVLQYLHSPHSDFLFLHLLKAQIKLWFNYKVMTNMISMSFRFGRTELLFSFSNFALDHDRFTIGTNRDSN